MRLQKFLAECGVASRRKCETIIRAGRVQVNGVPAALGQSIDPDTDTVTLDGRPLIRDTECYIVLNKPAGTVTTASDTHDRRTVYDCLAELSTRVVPVGRLDMDVTGTLLLTNDGELAHRLMHPRYEIDKTYEALVEGCMTRETAEKLAAGIELEDGATAPAEVQILETVGGASLIRLTVHEGRNRLVKRMCAAVGHPVRRLHRIAVAGLTVEGLEPGEWRYLREDEVRALKKLTRLDAGP